MRITFRLKSFPDHKGIPGHQGGSLPSDEVWTQNQSQEFTSAKTSINSHKLPAVFSQINFKAGTVNVDIGGGRFDNATEYLKTKDVENLIYDPYNRTAEHNFAVMRKVAGGKADTATVSNVLNVIKEPENRLKVINQAYDVLKTGGIAYIKVYAGDQSGIGKSTSSGWQENRKIATYLEEVRSVFSSAYVKNDIIVATK
jgi:hypothetical protein